MALAGALHSLAPAVPLGAHPVTVGAAAGQPLVQVLARARRVQGIPTVVVHRIHIVALHLVPVRTAHHVPVHLDLAGHIGEVGVSDGVSRGLVS